MSRLGKEETDLRLLVMCMAVATVSWFFAFFVPIGNFWIKITLSALCLAFLAVVFGGCQLPFKDLNSLAIFWGVLSALFLYGVFMAGNAVSSLLFPFAETQVDAIYAKGNNTPG